MARVVLKKLDPLVYADELDKIRRGFVIKVDLDPVLHDSNEPHPCVVMTLNAIIAKEHKYMVVPITSHSGGATPRSYEVPLKAGDGGLEKDCYAQPFLVQTIKRTRVLEIWGKLSGDAIDRIETGLLRAFGIEMADDDG